MEMGHLTDVDDLLLALCPQKLGLKKIQLSPQISLDSMLLLWPLLFVCTGVEAQGPRQSLHPLAPHPGAQVQGGVQR